MSAVDTVQVRHDMPEPEYHAHPALSSSGARKLLPPSCPAIFDHERRNPPEGKQVFDIGSAAHKVVLGAGPKVRVVDAKDWRTKEAKAERDAIRADGDIPVLPHEWQQVNDMADALKDHPVAARLFEHGTPELSLFWRDDRSGVECRMRLDWLTENVMGEPVIVDYKTCHSADPGQLARSVASFGYHQQHAWYVEGAHEAGVAEDPSFVFVCQEKTPPYPVTVLALDADAVRVGHARNRKARSIFAQCLATDEWPGYTDRIVDVSLPRWARGETS